MPKTPEPRVSCFMGRRECAQRKGDTWLEPESLCYPSGGMLRRARARCGDGKMRVVRCGIPDTFFSIPAAGKIRGEYVRGFVSVDTDADEFEFTATGPAYEEKPCAISSD